MLVIIYIILYIRVLLQEHYYLYIIIMLKFLVGRCKIVMIIFSVVTTRALRRSTMGASDDYTVGLHAFIVNRTARQRRSAHNNNNNRSNGTADLVGLRAQYYNSSTYNVPRKATYHIRLPPL